MIASAFTAFTGVMFLVYGNFKEGFGGCCATGNRVSRLFPGSRVDGDT
jgi:hypothetical protein